MTKWAPLPMFIPVSLKAHEAACTYSFSLSHLPHAGVDWLICNCTNSPVTAAGWRGLSSRPAACRLGFSLPWDGNSILFKQINTISRVVCDLTRCANVQSCIPSGIWRDADVVKLGMSVTHQLSALWDQQYMMWLYLHIHIPTLQEMGKYTRYEGHL